MKVLFLAAILLSGCAADGQGFVWEDRTTAISAYLDGKQVWIIECETRLSPCHEKAAEVCPNGYEIENQGQSGSGPGRTNKVTTMMQLTASCR